MKKTWKAGLSALTLGATLFLAAPGSAQAQDCRDCGPYNYCEDICQWEFHGEIYFDQCRWWYSPCLEYTAATTVEPLPSFMVPAEAASSEVVKVEE